ncbi:hypothetical protein SAMN05421858_1576 [Haladaptatus litoreus]|uniref:Uncharacterized protein n=1 Tax=Haladaptatus litoreus TaxID=553468 RepID=A0A1N6YI99_9EURY|nr:hypothetical protein [Haladaptatus litoreus]SIR14211.1 hypothetical protein SAMN05421858_1576 [Haladaptatus litoreus]
MDSDRLETFTENVQSGISRLESAFESSDSFEDVSAEATKLWELLDEGEDVLDELDLTDLPDIVDAGDVPKAIDVEDLPDAISEGDPKEAIDTIGVVRALELRELWSSTDMRELWREAREFEDAVTDYTGDSEGDGEDDGMLSGMDTDMDVGMDGPGNTEMDSELYQSKIQSELHDSVESFREKLLETRNKLAAIKEENESKGNVGQPNSRNPTAYSTMAGSRPDMGKATHFSTVPTETRYSSAPNSKRIYGRRFEEEDDA